MIVTWILSLIIIIIFSIFIFRKMAKNNIKDKYEICTYGLRKYNIIAFIIYILGFVFMVMSIFMVKDIFSFWCCLILGLFLIILTLVIFIDNNFSFEAIKGDKFYVSRFFKTREIKISKIRKIHSTGIYMIFYSKEEKKICMVDSSTRFIQDIVSHMQIYYNVKVINGTELEVMYVNEEEAKEDEDYEKNNIKTTCCYSHSLKDVLVKVSFVSKNLAFAFGNA